MEPSALGAAPIPLRWTVADYYRLVDRGVIGASDRVELLAGVIVAMSPQNPRHAACVARTADAIRRAVGGRAAVRSQLDLVASAESAVEPDVAVVPGQQSDYDLAHPTKALLVVEVADSSLVQDRVTKGSIYAAAGIAEYWIVNLVQDQVEVFRDPDPESRRYVSTAVAKGGESIALAAFPEARVAVDDLIPRRS